MLMVVVVILILLGLYHYMNPHRNTVNWEDMNQSVPYTQRISKEQAVSDLEYMMDTIKDKHISSLKVLPKQVSKQYTIEVSNLSSRPTVLELWMASSRIMNKLGDAHSSVYYNTNSITGIDIDLKQDGNILLCTNGKRKGDRVLKIDGISVDSLYKRFLSQFSYENEFWAESQFPHYLKIKYGLNWLGIHTSDSVKIDFDHAGSIQSENYKFMNLASKNQNDTKFISYTIDKHKSIGILTINSCEFNSEYVETLKKFFTDVKTNNIKSIAVDLRRNGGGNSEVANEFIRYLPIDKYTNFGRKIRMKYWIFNSNVKSIPNKKYENLLYDGNVYVLTSKSTFSSATQFAVLLRDNNLCKIIGEPSGNKPSAYGDVLSFQMPNSKLAFTVTYKQFYRPDVSRDKDKVLVPDYYVNADKSMEKFYRLTDK